MQNIAIFIDDYSLLGGAQKVTYNLSQLFYDNNIPIKAIFTRTNSKSMNYPYPQGVEIIEFGDNIQLVIDYINNNKIGNLIVQIENLKNCHELIEHLDYLNIKFHNILHSSPNQWFRKYYDFNQYITEPKLILQWFKMICYWRPLHRKLFNKLISKHGLICVGKQSAKEMQIIMGGRFNHNIDYIYNPLVFPSFELDYSHKENILLYCGRISQEKRPITMLKVWKLIYAKVPNWKFILLGDGPELNKVKKFIADNNLYNIEVKGQVNDVDRYLRLSKISILLSKYEGLPTGLLEAIYYGNAIIGSISDGGIHDIVHENKNGSIVAPNDIDEISSQLLALMEDDVICKSKCLESRKHFNKFSQNIIINKWLSHLI